MRQRDSQIGRGRTALGRMVELYHARIRGIVKYYERFEDD